MGGGWLHFWCEWNNCMVVISYGCIITDTSVDNPRVDILIGLQLCMDTRKVVGNPPHPS